MQNQAVSHAVPTDSRISMGKRNHDEVSGNFFNYLISPCFVIAEMTESVVNAEYGQMVAAGEER